MGRSTKPVVGVGPRRCLEANPTRKSIRLNGRFINISELARQGPFDHGFLSVILSGKRYPTIPYAERIAECLGMGLEELLIAIRERRAEMDEDYERKIDVARGA